MTRAIAARQAGDCFQARWFWHHASRLISGSECIEQVGFEVSEFKAFDDVIVKFKKPVPDRNGNWIVAEYYQVKFHVRGNDSITLAALMDPKFINASTTSLMQRLKQAYLQSVSARKPSLFHLVTQWGVRPDDILYELLENEHGKLRLDVLLDGAGDNSRMGKVRTRLRAHLECTKDDELSDILSCFRIKIFPMHLESFQEDLLNPAFAAAGMAVVERDRQFNEYDDLIWKLHGEGSCLFSRDELINVLSSNRLFKAVSHPLIQCKPKTLGIRSFNKWSAYLEDSVDELLCLLEFFSDRKISNDTLWTNKIIPNVTAFFERVLKQGETCRLYLETHSCIAFLAGVILNSRSGIQVEIAQTTLGKGATIWTLNDRKIAAEDAMWNFTESSTLFSGKQLVVGVSATHDISKEVELYSKAVFPEAKILLATLSSGPAMDAVINGKHAFDLAYSLARKLRDIRSVCGFEEIHFFVASPKAILFFLGQIACDLGKFAFYDHDSSNPCLPYHRTMDLSV